MTSNILIKGRHTIELDKDKVCGVNFKDIPVVRYELESYLDDSIEYIKNCIAKFNKSLHIIQVKYGDRTEEYDNLKELKKVNGVFVFLYIDMKDTDNLFYINLIVKEYDIDRVILIDDGSMGLLEVKRVTNEASAMFGNNKVGVCSMSISDEERCCLSAEKIREFATWCDVDITVVRGKQMDCGCFPHIVIDRDILKEVQVKHVKSTSSSTGSSKKVATLDLFLSRLKQK